MEFLLIFLYLVREHKYYPKNILYNLDKYYERWVGVRGAGEDEVRWMVVGRRHNQCGMPLVKLLFPIFIGEVIFLIFKELVTWKNW